MVSKGFRPPLKWQPPPHYEFPLVYGSSLLGISAKNIPLWLNPERQTSPLPTTLLMELWSYFSGHKQYRNKHTSRRPVTKTLNFFVNW